ncbi:MAG: hypothetical protein AB1762_14375 [Gemmatimonadota bacterium]
MPNELDGTLRDSLPPNCERIEVRVQELRDLFNAIDPSPFRSRDLDADVELFIVSWAREAHGSRPLALVVHVEQQPESADAEPLLRDAVRAYFSERSAASRRRLRQLLRVGRTSLFIGLLCLSVSVALSQALENVFVGFHPGGILRESVLIGGWVAMWRPLEIFLYDWWPIRDDAKLFDRLSAMPVRVVVDGHVQRH